MFVRPAAGHAAHYRQCNLFVVQGLTGHNIFYVARSVLPFFLLLCAGIVIITIYPDIVTWLPRTMLTPR